MTGKKVTTLHRSFHYLKVFCFKKEGKKKKGIKNSRKGIFQYGHQYYCGVRRKATAGLLRRYKKK